jgi:hypothetical protein
VNRNQQTEGLPSRTRINSGSEEAEVRKPNLDSRHCVGSVKA